MNGYFKLHRQIFESDIWMYPDKLRLFIFLVGQARFRKKPNTKYKNKGVVIEQSQFLRSYRKLQEDLEYFYNNAIKQYSLSKIKRIISDLEEEDRIKTEKTQLGTLFTVVNYRKYQGLSDIDKEPGTDLERSPNRVGTESEQGWNNTERMEKEWCKNGERKNNNNSGDKFSIKKLDNGRYEYPDGYEEVYEIYPDNKGTKKAGWRKWAARRRNGVSNDKLIEAVLNYAKECKKENRDKKYVKHISTFFGPDEHWKQYIDLREVNDDGRNSGDNNENNGKGGKDEGARLTKKAFELMGFEEE